LSISAFPFDVPVTQQLQGEGMTRKMFVNVPVKDLKTSTDFFRKLDFQLNAQFTDDAAACMIVSEGIYVMLLTEDKFKAVTPKQISDATNFRAITGTWRSFVIRIWTI
jgi:predicted lactoylglutathione lyase